MNEQSENTLKVVGLFVALGLAAVMVMWGGFCFMLSWNMLIPQQFNLPRLSLLMAMSAMLIARGLSNGIYGSGGKTDNSLSDLAIRAIVFPAVFLLFAWILSLFL